MGALRSRPEIHVPWQVLASSAAVVYLVRSALRGWDFRADLTDLVVLGLFAVVLLLRPLVAGLADDIGEDPRD